MAIMQLLQQDLNKWAETWQMKTNVAFSSYPNMIIKQHFHIYVKQTSQNVKQHSYLGIIIDHDLS